jgi:hypothetical protein
MKNLAYSGGNLSRYNICSLDYSRIFPILSMTSGAAQPRFWLWVSMTFAAGLIFMEISRREAINTISEK